MTINTNNQLVEGQPGPFDELPPDEGLVSDISLALGLHKDIFANRGYQGWWGQPWTNFLWQNKWSKFSQDEWRRLGAGDSVGEALMIAIGGQPGSSDPNAPINSFRFKGQGEIDNIRLVGN